MPNLQNMPTELNTKNFRPPLPPITSNLPNLSELMSILSSKSFRSPPPPNPSDLRILTILDIRITSNCMCVVASRKVVLEDSHIMNDIVLYSYKKILHMLYINM
jgi:hypothetical protein